jgi:hypothetical protein
MWCDCRIVMRRSQQRRPRDVTFTGGVVATWSRAQIAPRYVHLLQIAYSPVIRETRCSGFPPFVIIHLNNNVSTLHNLFCSVGITAHCPAIAQTAFSSVRLSLSDVEYCDAARNEAVLQLFDVIKLLSVWRYVDINLHATDTPEAILYICY